MKSNKQKTFEEWMDEDRFDGMRDAIVSRKKTISIPRYLFAKEVWAAAGGKFKSDDDEVSDEV